MVSAMQMIDGGSDEIIAKLKKECDDLLAVSKRHPTQQDIQLVNEIYNKVYAYFSKMVLMQEHSNENANDVVNDEEKKQTPYVMHPSLYIEKTSTYSIISIRKFANWPVNE